MQRKWEKTEIQCECVKLLLSFGRARCFVILSQCLKKAIIAGWISWKLLNSKHTALKKLIVLNNINCSFCDLLLK